MSSKNTNSLIIKTSNGMIELPAHISLDQKARKKLEQQSEESFWNNEVYTNVLKRLAQE